MSDVNDVVDCLVIGAGGAGYPGAIFLAKAGWRVVMIDPFGNLGGNCLAEGCVPSKAVREAANVRMLAMRQDFFGLRGVTPEVDWQQILAHKDRVQHTRYAQHTDETALPNLTMLKGEAELLDESTAALHLADGSTSTCRFRHLLLATGSRPVRLPIPGAEWAITSHDLFRMGANLPKPEVLAIIGGGYIGVETASMLQALGTRCTILEHGPRVLSGFDDELADMLQTRLAQRVQIETSAQVMEISRPAATGVRVHYRKNGEDAWLDADAVLMATGRAPVLPRGFACLGIELVRGAVPVDETLRTSHPRVWAPGDVNGRSMLFHSAVRQSQVAAHNMLAGGQVVDRMNFSSVPMTVFTDPELAHVGLTAAQAIAQFGEAAVAVTRYDYAHDSRAQIYGLTDGFIKLVFDRRTRRLLGCQIAGMDAAQLIAVPAMAIEAGLDASVLANTAFPHPMLSEGLCRAARQFLA